MLSLPPIFDGNTAMDVTSCVLVFNFFFRKQHTTTRPGNHVSTILCALSDPPVATYLDHDVHFLEHGMIGDAVELRADHVLRDILLREQPQLV